MTQASDQRDAYARAGVDIDAGQRLVERIAGLARSTARPGARPDLGGFGAIFDLAACGYRDPLLVASTDGVGTKILLAREADRLEVAGVDLVAMCVNDIVVQGAAPLFFLDYYATGRLEPERAARVVAGIARGCREADCALIGGETAEMPGLYAAGEWDLAGFAVGAVERDRLLPRPAEPGDVILGLASSGPHANGFTLIRRVLADRRLTTADRPPFAAEGTLADLLLAPTRIYVRSCLEALGCTGLRAFAHITGGGLLDNLPRVLPAGRLAVIEAGSWPLPPLFSWLAETGGLGARELARTFNCGIGMCAIVAAEAAETVAGTFRARGETVYRIGHILAGPGPARVELTGAEAAWNLDGPRS